MEEPETPKGARGGKEGKGQRLVLQGRSPVRLQNGVGRVLFFLEGAEGSQRLCNKKLVWEHWFPS